MPEYDPIETSSKFTSDRVWEAYTSKYTTAGNYAVWAQNLLESNVLSIKTALNDGTDGLKEKLIDLFAALDGVTGYTAGSITQYVAPPTPTYFTDVLGDYTPAEMAALNDVPAYTSPGNMDALDDIPAYDKPDVPDYEVIPDYAAPTLGTITDIPAYVPPDKPVYINVPGYTAPQLAAMLDIPELVPLSVPDAPSTNISFTNSNFTDDLLTDAKAKLAADIASGSTGLGDAEAGLFARETARQNAARVAAYTELTTQFSSRGFDMPPGALLAKQTEVNNQTAIILADSSSQIMAESARLAVDYNKHVLSVCVQLEDMLGRLHDSKLARDFDAAKTTVQLELEGFKAIIEVEIAKGNLQKVFVDASVAANDGNIKVFMGKLEGELEPIKAAVSINQNIVQQYSSEISASVAPLDAIVKNNDAVIRKYLGEIQAATDPIKVLADVNKSYAQLYLSDLDAAIKPIQAAIQRNDGIVKGYLGKVEAATSPIKAIAEVNMAVVSQYKSESEARIAPVMAKISANQATAHGLSAAVSAESARVTTDMLPEELKIKQTQLELDEMKIRSGITTEASRFAIESAARNTQMSVTTLGALSQQYAQIIASSFNTVSASASLSYQGQGSTRYDGDIVAHDSTTRYAIDKKVTPPSYT